ncbi:hypothetical protein D3C80_1742410 [compost metagenome]
MAVGRAPYHLGSLKQRYGRERPDHLPLFILGSRPRIIVLKSQTLTDVTSHLVVPILGVVPRMVE